MSQATQTPTPATPDYLLAVSHDDRDAPRWADIQAGEARKEIEAGRLGDAVVSLCRASY